MLPVKVTLPKSVEALCPEGCGHEIFNHLVGRNCQAVIKKTKSPQGYWRMDCCPCTWKPVTR